MYNNQSAKNANTAVTNGAVSVTPTLNTSAATTVCGTADWSLSVYKGGMLEPPSSCSSGSPPGTQDLWWTERLVVEAQQEFPGELGESASLYQTGA